MNTGVSPSNSALQVQYINYCGRVQLQIEDCPNSTAPAEMFRRLAPASTIAKRFSTSIDFSDMAKATVCKRSSSTRFSLSKLRHRVSNFLHPACWTPQHSLLITLPQRLPISRPRARFPNASLSELNSVQALFLLRVAENSLTQVDSGVVRLSVRQGNPTTMPGLSTLGSYAFLPNTSRTIGAKNDRSSVGNSGSKDD